MNICKPHWDALKFAITSRGLGDFIAKDSAEVMRQIKTSFANPDILKLEDFDPLMAANNMIFSQAMRHRGLALLQCDEATGRPPCPLCVVAGPNAQNWIDGASDQAAEMVAELRLGPVDLKKEREKHGQREER